MLPANFLGNYNNNYKDNFENNFDNDYIDVFGIKLYFDDILLICLLFFLYNEDVHDYHLFITLILLLLS